MLKSVSYMQTATVDISLLCNIWAEIESLHRYFYKFAGTEAHEAEQQVLLHALTHYKADKGNIKSYIKKLSREILKDNGKTVAVDFMEDTLGDGDEVLKVSDQLLSNVQHSTFNDFSEDIVTKIDAENHRKREITEYALMSIDRFLILCEAILRRDTTTTYYPENFIKETLKLSGKYQNFNDLCINIYNSFGEEMKWFLDIEKNTVNSWKEADFNLNKNKVSKRVRFINTKTGEPVLDADIEEYRLETGTKSSTDKHIYKIEYATLWNRLCDLVDDEDTNELKFIIDKSYIIRTLGGSFQLNADLYNMYDLIRNEIVTNILLDTNCRLINVGSECIYLLQEGNGTINIPNRTIKGIEVNFSVEDITDTIIQ
jgi:hypothetical protein